MPVSSLRALRAFAETARCGSLAGAARSLNVTPSAVSHLLRTLEQALSVTLFASHGPQIHFTEAGAALGRRLTEAFDAIDRAVAEVRHQASDVRVCWSPTPGCSITRATCPASPPARVRMTGPWLRLPSAGRTAHPP
jgi:DNA-binding transcriptional LysR family regulator